jgi:hypothetical protein
MGEPSTLISGGPPGAILSGVTADRSERLYSKKWPHGQV